MMNTIQHNDKNSTELRVKDVFQRKRGMSVNMAEASGFMFTL